MRVVGYLAFLLLLLTSCEEEPPFIIDETGTPQLDTARVDMYNYTVVNIPCQQVLIVEARPDFSHEFLLSIVLSSLNARSAEWTDSSYLWTPSGDTTRAITVADIPSTITYEVEITYTIELEYLDMDSMWRDSTLILPLTDEITVRRNNAPLYVIPHAFTPNGDGFNDEFKVSAICFSESHLRIFDSFSNTLLFESTDINYGWDGTHKGKKMAVEEYRYQFEITSMNNQVFESEGYLQLVR